MPSNSVFDTTHTVGSDEDSAIHLLGEDDTVVEYPHVPKQQNQSADLSSFFTSPSDLHTLYFDIKSAANLNGQWSDPRAIKPLPLSVEEARKVRALLGFGGPPEKLHELSRRFVFEVEGRRIEAANAGLEAFLCCERSLREWFGQGALEHHLEDYINNLSYILSEHGYDDSLHQTLNQLRESDAPRSEKYRQLIHFLTDYTEDLRSSLLTGPNDHRFRTAGTYHILLRQFHHEGFRQRLGRKAPETGKFFQDVSKEDLLYIRDVRGCKAILVSGIFPIGERFRKGPYGGSPWSIKDNLGFHEDYGTKEDFKAFVKLAHELGMYVLIDDVPNHTSADSALLMEDPTLFQHYIPSSPDEQPAPGSFEHIHRDGTRYFIAHGAHDNNGEHAVYSDTAQLDLSNPRTRERRIEIAMQQLEEYGHDGFRIDMGHCVTEEYRRRTWDERYRQKHGWPVEESENAPEREYLDEFHYRVKEQFPKLITVVESYDKHNTIGGSGATATYNKCDNYPTYGAPRIGFRDAMVSRDPRKISAALSAHEYDYWEVGRSTMMNFIVNHDEAALRRALALPYAEKDPARAAQVAETHWRLFTVCMELIPGCKITPAGAEVGTDQADKESEGDLKPLPFTKDSKIDWGIGHESLELIAGVHALPKLGQGSSRRSSQGSTDRSSYQVLPETVWTETEWIGFRNGSYIFVGNPTDNEVDYRFTDNKNYSGSLAPGQFFVLDRDTGETVLA